MTKRKSEIAVGDKVFFRSGNFEGLYGQVLEVDFENQKAPFGFHHKVQLSNGKIGFIEKNEHWVYLTESPEAQEACQHKFILREYPSQTYGSCADCGEFVY